MFFRGIELPLCHVMSEMGHRFVFVIAEFCAVYIFRMKTGVGYLFGLLAAVAASGCSEGQATHAVAPVRVKTLTVEAGVAQCGRTYSGTVEEQSGTSLSFAGVGTVRSVDVSEGQFVAAGQLIGTLDETSARNAYEAALAAKEQALDAQGRMRMLHDAGSLADIKWIEVQTQVRQAQASERIAKKALDDTRLYAPFGGYVAQKNVEAGANVVVGMPVVKLVTIDEVKVKISVPEGDIAAIRVGMPIQVSVGALGGRIFSGKVTERGVSADAISRSYEVKAAVPNPRHELLPGMIAEVVVGGGAPEAGGAIAIPARIVQLNADNRTFVWTVEGGRARKAFVKTGENVGDMVVVLDGLGVGDTVIALGQQKVSSGMAVTE